MPRIARLADQPVARKLAAVIALVFLLLCLAGSMVRASEPAATRSAGGASGRNRAADTRTQLAGNRWSCGFVYCGW
jgi:hypothetical protein